MVAVSARWVVAVECRRWGVGAYPVVGVDLRLAAGSDRTLVAAGHRSRPTTLQGGGQPADSEAFAAYFASDQRSITLVSATNRTLGPVDGSHR